MPLLDLPLPEIFPACVVFQSQREIKEVKGDVGGKGIKEIKEEKIRGIYKI